MFTGGAKLWLGGSFSSSLACGRETHSFLNSYFILPSSFFLFGHPSSLLSLFLPFPPPLPPSPPPSLPLPFTPPPHSFHSSPPLFLPLPYPSSSGLSSSAQRRDALRLLCLLLPQPNRDTLLELLQFLSRVALHSDGIILIDGTEVGAEGKGGKKERCICGYG